MFCYDYSQAMDSNESNLFIKLEDEWEALIEDINDAMVDSESFPSNSDTSMSNNSIENSSPSILTNRKIAKNEQILLWYFFNRSFF